MSERVLCKFFAHGACLKGEHCTFSHDWKDQQNNICTFYQSGLCSYGSRCRYEHVKVSCQTSALSSSSSHPHVPLNSAQLTHPSSVALSCEPLAGSSIPSDLSSSSGHLHPLVKQPWTQDSEAGGLSENVNCHDPTLSQPADQLICSFAAAGNCPYGERCSHIHGDLCATCGKHCLHPYRPDEREEHRKLCQENSKCLEALRYSQEIECSVCLERVLSKPTPAERKFGLLSECDHPFCISCIRNWRSNPPSSGMNVNTALRACPICRKLSYFVIPSVTWYSSKEEKQEIIDSYKARLRSIDCKHFNFGNGRCPFGTSCFYKHTYKPHMSRPRVRGMPQTHRRCRNAGINEDELEDLDAEEWLRNVGMYEDELEELGAEEWLRNVGINEDELEELGAEEWLRNVGINEDELEDLDAGDVDYNSLMTEMTFLLMQFGFDEWESASEEEN